MTSDVVDAGIGYTVLDDFHFRAAGLRDQQLGGYYLTEDDGRVLKIFPGSEHLRYTIPFRPCLRHDRLLPTCRRTIAWRRIDVRR